MARKKSLFSSNRISIRSALLSSPVPVDSPRFLEICACFFINFSGLDRRVRAGRLLIANAVPVFGERFLWGGSTEFRRGQDNWLSKQVTGLSEQMANAQLANDQRMLNDQWPKNNHPVGCFPGLNIEHSTFFGTWSLGIGHCVHLHRPGTQTQPRRPATQCPGTHAARLWGRET